MEDREKCRMSRGHGWPTPNSWGEGEGEEEKQSRRRSIPPKSMIFFAVQRHLGLYFFTTSRAIITQRNTYRGVVKINEYSEIVHLICIYSLSRFNSDAMKRKRAVEEKKSSSSRIIRTYLHIYRMTVVTIIISVTFLYTFLIVIFEHAATP